MESKRFGLWAQFITLNLLWFSMLGLAHWLPVTEGKSLTGLLLGESNWWMYPLIFGYFLVGLLLCVPRVLRLSSNFAQLPKREGKLQNLYINVAKQRGAQEAIVGLQEHLSGKLTYHLQIVKTLPMLGMLGTFGGIMMALWNLQGADLANDAVSVLPTLLSGMAFAFGTSLVAGVLWLWLSWVVTVLESSSKKLMVAIIDSANTEIVNGGGGATGGA